MNTETSLSERVNAPKNRARIRGARRLTVTQRLYRAVDSSGPCHVFTGSTTAGGYGQISVDGRRVLVHRLAWQLSGGSLPPNMVLDHLCTVRRCCNWHHCRLATSAQNRANRHGSPDYSLTDVEGIFFMGRWQLRADRFRAVLSGGGLSVLLGHYGTFEDAALALEQAKAGYQLPLPGIESLTDGGVAS